jgi:hypothetical protein
MGRRERRVCQRPPRHSTLWPLAATAPRKHLGIHADSDRSGSLLKDCWGSGRVDWAVRAGTRRRAQPVHVQGCRHIIILSVSFEERACVAASSRSRRHRRRLGLLHTAAAITCCTHNKRDSGKLLCWHPTSSLRGKSAAEFERGAAAIRYIVATHRGRPHDDVAVAVGARMCRRVRCQRR